MRHTRPILLALVALLSACEKAGPTARNVPEPADLIAVVSVASPKAALARVRAYAESVSPGSGTAMRDDLVPAALSQLVGAPTFDGLDIDKPTHLLVLDPRKHKHPVVILATVGDKGKVEGLKNVKVTMEGNRAVIGPAAEVDLVAPYAFGVIATRPAPAAATATCSPAKLIGLYRADLEALKKQMAPMLAAQSPAMGKVLEVELDLVMRLAEQTEVARFTVDAGDKDASIDLAFVPRAGTTFDSWAKAQKVADLGLLEKLPTVEHPTMVIAGNMQLGPLRDVLLEAMGPLMESVMGVKLDRAKWNAFLDGFDGTVAGLAWSGEGGVMNLDELAGSSDGPKLVALSRELFGLQAGPPRTGEVMGMKWTFQALPEATVDGATVLGYEMTPDYASFPEAQRELMRRAYGDVMKIQFAGYDKLVAVTMGPGAAERVKTIIEASRKGGGQISAGARAALEAARGRKASFAIYMDLARAMAAMMPNAPPSASGAVMELGVSDGATHLRIGVPAAHVRELMAIFGR